MRVFHDRGPGKHVAGNRNAVATAVAAPVDAAVSGMGCNSPLHVHQMHLTSVASRIRGYKGVECRNRAKTACQQLKSNWSQQRLDQRLGADRTNFTLCIGAVSADRKELARDRVADSVRFRVTCNNGPSLGVFLILSATRRIDVTYGSLRQETGNGRSFNFAAARPRRFSYICQRATSRVPAIYVL